MSTIKIISCIYKVIQTHLINTESVVQLIFMKIFPRMNQISKEILDWLSFKVINGYHNFSKIPHQLLV